MVKGIYCSKAIYGFDDGMKFAAIRWIQCAVEEEEGEGSSNEEEEIFFGI